MINSFDPMIHGLKNIYILRQGFKDIFRRHFVLCIHKTEVYTVQHVCLHNCEVSWASNIKCFADSAKVIFVRYTGTRVQGYKGTRVQGYKGTRVQGYKGTWVHGYTGTRVHGHWAHGYTGTSLVITKVS